MIENASETTTHGSSEVTTSVSTISINCDQSIGYRMDEKLKNLPRVSNPYWQRQDTTLSERGRSVVTIREQVLLLTRRLDDWRRVVELIGSLFCDPPLTPSVPLYRDLSRTLSVLPRWLRSFPVRDLYLRALSMHTPVLFSPYQPTYVTARRRGDAATPHRNALSPSRFISAKLFILLEFCALAIFPALRVDWIKKVA